MSLLHLRASGGRALLGLAAGALLAACSSSPSASPAGTAGSSGAAAATSSAGPTSTSSGAAGSGATPSAMPSRTAASATPSAAPTTTPGPLPCRTGQLRVTLGPAEGAAGSTYRPLRFTNRGSTTCTLSGHPGVSYVAGADGHQVGSPATRTGTPVHVVLRPGATASATLRGVRYETQDPARCRPTAVTGLRVYPPDQRASAFLRAPGRACAATGVRLLVVEPVRPGPGGR